MLRLLLPSVRGLALVMTAGLASGCVGSGLGVPNEEPDPEAVPTSYAEIQTMIFDPMCAARCHRGGAAPKGLSLELGRAYRALVGVESVELPALLRVMPGRAEDSYLIVKLGVADPRRVGARMPRTGPPFLSNRQIRVLKRWIRDGAAEDWIDEGDVDAGTDAAVPTTDAASAEIDASWVDATVPDAL